jgi:hypothetical protein
MMMKRIFPLGLITLGILLSLGAVSQLYLNNRVSSSATLDLPNQLAGLRMTNSKRGAQAISEFTDLHGKEFPVTFGAVGVYGNREITLWVAGTASDSIASELTNAMQGRIAEGNSPFTPVDEFNQRNRIVYVLEGMGQKHYYFQSENLVIWLAADPAYADKALQQILEVYS